MKDIFKEYAIVPQGLPFVTYFCNHGIWRNNHLISSRFTKTITLSIHSFIHFHSWLINYKANNGFSSSSFCSFLDLWPVAAAMLGTVSAAVALSAKKESNSERRKINTSVSKKGAPCGENIGLTLSKHSTITSSLWCIFTI